MKLTQILSIVFVLVLFSCKESNINETSNKTGNEFNENTFNISGYPMILPEGVSEDDITGRIAISKTKFWGSLDPEFDYEAVSSSFIGYFFNQYVNYAVDAGEISMSGIQVSKEKFALSELEPNNPDSTTSYQSFDDLFFNSTQYIIQGTGSGMFPPFSLNITSPSQEVNLLTPAHHQTISKNTDLTISWDFVPDSNHVILVGLSDFNNSSGVKYYTTQSDYLAIPKQKLNTLVNGEVMVYVKCFTYKLEPIGGGEYVLAYIVTSNSIWVNLTN